jgi:hypothetical protein
MITNMAAEQLATTEGSNRLISLLLALAVIAVDLGHVESAISKHCPSYATYRSKSSSTAAIMVMALCPKIDSIQRSCFNSVQTKNSLQKTKNQPSRSLQCRAIGVQTAGLCDCNHDFSTEQGKPWNFAMVQRHGLTESLASSFMLQE